MLEGSCHCGALTLRLDTRLTPAELPVRTCGCTFCRRVGPRYTSDPTGHVTITLASRHAAHPYRFGAARGRRAVVRRGSTRAPDAPVISSRRE